MQRLRDRILAWYDGARRDLPWRRTRDPYAIWLSEIMLQQTRVETVIPYYERFLRELPTVQALAEASTDEVLSLWGGLGYYRRARLLHDAARAVVKEHGGAFTNTVEGLRKLPGIGAYTAGAIASIAFQRKAALVDGNVARVLSRLHAIEDDVRGGEGLAKVWRAAEALVPEERPGDWNQALMELGATVCLPHAPRCLLCPANEECVARARGIEAELPRLKAKAKPKRAGRIAVLITKGEEVLLARRAPDGTFGGMWEPPSVPIEADRPKDVSVRFAELFGTPVEVLEPVGHVVHVLSHRRLEIQVLRARIGELKATIPLSNSEYDALRFVPRADPGRLGITKLARKILALGA